MKTLILIVMMTAGAQPPLKAQEARNYKQAAIENYVWNFRYGNIGVMESSLETVVQFRDVYPEGDFRPVIARLRYLSTNGPTERIRMKALLVAAILEKPDTKVTELLLTLHR